MSFLLEIDRLNGLIDSTETDLNQWLALPPNILATCNDTSRWSVQEVLEHIALTSHFLLILIEKGARKALAEAEKHGILPEPEGYSIFPPGIGDIGTPQAFDWPNPPHMEPTGIPAAHEIEAQLRNQWEQCRAVLARLPNGEGRLYRTTMTVNSLGKLDVYQYIAFLTLHARRHIPQMQRILK